MAHLLAIRYAEAYEGWEYGAAFSEDDVKELFPFFEQGLTYS